MSTWCVTTLSSFGTQFTASPTSPRPSIGNSPRRIAMAFPAGSDRNRGTDQSAHLFSSAPPVLLRTSETRDDDTRGWTNTGMSPTNSPRPCPAAVGTFDEQGHRRARQRWQKTPVAMQVSSAFRHASADKLMGQDSDAGVGKRLRFDLQQHQHSLHPGSSSPTTTASPRLMLGTAQRVLLDAYTPLPQPPDAQAIPASATPRRLGGQRPGPGQPFRPPGFVSRDVLSPRSSFEEGRRFAEGTHVATPRYTWESGYCVRAERGHAAAASM